MPPLRAPDLRPPPSARPGDDGRGGVRGVLQGPGGQVAVSLRDLGLAVLEDLLHLVERTPRIHQEAGIRVCQIVDAKMGESCLGPYAFPHFVDRGVGLSGLPVDEQILKLVLGIECVQHLDGAVFQGNGPGL